MVNAASPQVEVAPAAVSTTVDIHTGHMGCQFNFNKYDESNSAFRTRCSISS
jgi:hypothetical protein